jgi:hypothetical protein
VGTRLRRLPDPCRMRHYPGAAGAAGGGAAGFWSSGRFDRQCARAGVGRRLQAVRTRLLAQLVAATHHHRAVRRAPVGQAACGQAGEGKTPLLESHASLHAQDEREASGGVSNV